MNPTYYFDIQLKTGAEGENFFQTYFKAEKSPIYAYDFILDGQSIELKTDTYNSPNMFMEFWSDCARKKIGGPFRAAQDNVDLFVYFFPKKQKMYFFNSTELAKHLEENLESYSSRTIQNKSKDGKRSWETLGYLVPIDSIEHLTTKIETLTKKESA